MMLWLLMAALNLESVWNWDDPAESERRFRALQPATTNEALEVQTQIARAQGLQQKFDEAHKTLDAVVTSSPRVEVRCLLERGRVFNSSGHPDKAKPLFLAAWGKANAAKLDFFAVDAAHMLGIIEPPDEALAWNEKAVVLAQNSADPKAQDWLGSLYNNIGWTHYDKRDYVKALALFERDLAWFNARQKTNEARIAQYSIGKTLRALGRVEEALAIQREVLKARPDDNEVRDEIAECLKQLPQQQPTHDRK